MTTVVVVGLALLVGVALGALGGGGSILMVPLLVYVAGLEPQQGIATSLLVVGVTSAAATMTHAAGDRVRWRTGLVFGSSGAVGGFAGGMLGGQLPGSVLLVGFSAVMVAMALVMLLGRHARTERAGGEELRVVPAVLGGLTVGVVAGMVGAGGGFIVVPALLLLGGLSVSVAIGTSLLVVSMQSFAGLLGHLTSVSIPWGLATGVCVAAVAGSVLGGWSAQWVSDDRLRHAFGWFVLVMGVFVLVQEAQAPAWVLGVLCVAVGIAGVTVESGRQRRQRERPEPVDDNIAVDRS